MTDIHNEQYLTENRHTEEEIGMPPAKRRKKVYSVEVDIHEPCDDGVSITSITNSPSSSASSARLSFNQSKHEQQNNRILISTETLSSQLGGNMNYNIQKRKYYANTITNIKRSSSAPDLTYIAKQSKFDLISLNLLNVTTHPVADAVEKDKPSNSSSTNQ